MEWQRPSLRRPNILTAGRLSGRKQWVEEASRRTFASVKPSDGAIIGIYVHHADQPGEGAALTKKFGA